MNLDVGRQDLAIQIVGLGFHSFEDVLRLLSAQHENDAFHGIIILLKAEFAQPWRVPDGDIPNIAHADRHALVGADNDVSNVVGIAHQSNAAHVVELPALRIEPAAGVGVVGGQSRRHLRNGQVIAIDARRIEQDLILHGRSAEPRVVGYTGNRAIGPLHHPIFNRLQFLRTAIGTLQHVAIHQAAGAE